MIAAGVEPRPVMPLWDIDCHDLRLEVFVVLGSCAVQSKVVEIIKPSLISVQLFQTSNDDVLEQAWEPDTQR